MNRYIVTDIKWDTSGAELSEEERVSLPKKLTVFCDSEDQIADALSDQTGFLVESFIIEDCLES